MLSELLLERRLRKWKKEKRKSSIAVKEVKKMEEREKRKSSIVVKEVKKMEEREEEVFDSCEGLGSKRG